MLALDEPASFLDIRHKIEPLDMLFEEARFPPSRSDAVGEASGAGRHVDARLRLRQMGILGPAADIGWSAWSIESSWLNAWVATMLIPREKAQEGPIGMSGSVE